jgi:hypothetical protein
MASGYLIIDGRKEGLPDAAGYYKVFPREPSPLGDITLSDKKRTVMSTSSLDTVLGEMPKAGAGGIVVLVCHAFGEGMLLPIAPGGKLKLKVDTLASINKIIAVEMEVASIRRLPRKTPEEKKALLDRWEKLLNDITPGTLVGPYPIEELEEIIRKAEAVYGTFLDEQASRFEFANRAALLQMLAKLRRVRDLGLSRLELRACNIGDNGDTMKAVREFFNVANLTAPTLGTFYLPPTSPATMAARARPGGRMVTHGVHGAYMMPGITGIAPGPESPYLLNVMYAREVMSRGGRTTRGFFDRNPMSFWSLDWSIPLGIHYHFIITIDETEPYSYKYNVEASVFSTCDLRRRDWGVIQQDWGWVRWFVDGKVMPNSVYKSGPFPLAGFWNPKMVINRGLRGSVSVPFVFPNEWAYTEVISHVP